VKSSPRGRCSVACGLPVAAARAVTRESESPSQAINHHCFTPVLFALCFLSIVNIVYCRVLQKRKQIYCYQILLVDMFAIRIIGKRHRTAGTTTSTTSGKEQDEQPACFSPQAAAERRLRKALVNVVSSKAVISMLTGSGRRIRRGTAGTVDTATVAGASTSMSNEATNPSSHQLPLSSSIDKPGGGTTSMAEEEQDIARTASYDTVEEEGGCCYGERIVEIDPQAIEVCLVAGRGDQQHAMRNPQGQPAQSEVGTDDDSAPVPLPPPRSPVSVVIAPDSVQHVSSKEREEADEIPGGDGGDDDYDDPLAIRRMQSGESGARLWDEKHQDISGEEESSVVAVHQSQSLLLPDTQAPDSPSSFGTPPESLSQLLRKEEEEMIRHQDGVIGSNKPVDEAVAKEAVALAAAAASTDDEDENWIDLDDAVGERSTPVAAATAAVGVREERAVAAAIADDADSKCSDLSSVEDDPLLVRSTDSMGTPNTDSISTTKDNSGKVKAGFVTPPPAVEHQEDRAEDDADAPAEEGIGLPSSSASNFVPPEYVIITTDDCFPMEI